MNSWGDPIRIRREGPNGGRAHGREPAEVARAVQSVEMLRNKRIQTFLRRALLMRKRLPCNILGGERISN